MHNPFSDYQLKQKAALLEGYQIAIELLERTKLYFGHYEIEIDEYSGEDRDVFSYRVEMVGNVYIDDIYRKVKYADLAFAVKDVFQKMSESGDSIEDIFYSSHYRGLVDCDAIELIIKAHKDSEVDLVSLVVVFVATAGQIPQEILKIIGEGKDLSGL